ncbi:MAG TPA: DUF983 domain-containing protein, partial [Planctomycetota bacterium]|nr:DUF983 domain-containing protein [Planctomycetota bacterium]
MFARAVAMLLQRCPRCLEGKVFEGRFQMRSRCPVCGLDFEREAGYYLGAMYFSYAIACCFIGGPTIAVELFLPGLHAPVPVLVASLVFFLPFVPLTFRWSRVLWLHFDSIFDPALRAPQGVSSSTESVACFSPS